MIKKYIIFLLIFLHGFLLFATVQEPDILLYNGKEYRIWEEPMEYFFKQFPEKRPEWQRTNLWRCYIATFEIIQDELWVIDIKNSRNESIIIECLDGRDRMKINGYTGTLNLFIDNRHDRKVGSYAYNFYGIIKIENGEFRRSE